MPRTRYDQLIDENDTSTKGTSNPWHPWLSNEENFAEWVLDYLLDRYGLAGTRTKFMLMDLHKQHSDGERHADLGDFCRFFPEYPIKLSSTWLTKGDADRLTLPRFFLELDKIAALQNVLFEIDEFYRAEPGSWPHIADVIGGIRPKLAIQDSLVVHTWLPLNAEAPGPHFFFTTKDSVPIVVETLQTMLDEVDRCCPPETWLDSREPDDFREPVNTKEES